MKNLFVFVIIILFGHSINAQQNKGLCNVEINDVSKIVSFGYLVSYSVEFKNNTNKTVDGIYWNAYYYNNAGELVEQDKSSFNSTNIIEPIAMGFTKMLVRSPKIEGASKVFIKITKVHYSDGASCK